MNQNKRLELYKALLLKKRQRGLNDLFFFNKFILESVPNRKDLIVPHVHGEWATWFQDSQKRIRCILVPRSTFKSTFFTVGWTLQLLAQNQSTRILIANATLNNAQKFLGEIKNHIRKNETFRMLYGNFYDKNLKWTDEEIEIVGRTLNMREPNVTATGVGGNLVSQHYDYIIADDLVNLENSATRYQSDKVIDWWKRSLSLLEPTGIDLVVGTRWSYYELYSYLQSDLSNEVDFYIRSAHNKDRTLYFPERFTESKLAELKKLHGSYIYSCNPYEAPVLMADWSCKPIGEVKKGDIVVGWEVRKSGRRHLCKSKVLAVNSRRNETAKIYLKSGRIIRSTPNHRWWKQRFEKGRREYAPAKVGMKLRYVCNPYLQDQKLSQEQRDLANWLGGLYDGDGGFCGDAILFAQDKEHNPEVCKKIEYALDKLGYSWGNGTRPPTSGKIYGRTIKTSVEMQTYWLRGGFEEKRRFLLQCNPSKREKIGKKMFIRRSRFVLEKDEIVKIEKDKEDTVYGLQTETGNYIVWGYASSNSFYENNPIDPDTAIIKESQIKYFSESKGEKAKSVALLPENIVIFVAVDPAVSEGRLSDYSGFAIVAVDGRDNWYVLEARREKVSVGEMINTIFDLNDEYEPDSISLEVIAQGQALLSSVQSEEERRKIYLPIVEIKSQPMVKKETRIRSILQPRFERGKIYIKKEQDDLKDELLHFPLSQHDDLIDALAQIQDIAYAPSEKKEKKKQHYQSKLVARIKGEKDNELIDEFLGSEF